MCRPTDSRVAVLDGELADVLRRYMEFREAFRYAQFFHLNWQRTAPLIADFPRALDVFETRIDGFLSEAAGEPAGLAEKPAELPRYWSQPVKVKTVRLEKRPAVIMCVLAMAFGGITSFILARRHYGPWMPQVVPANVIDSKYELLSFLDPDERPVAVTGRDGKNPWLMTVGEIAEGGAEPFTGRLDRKGETPRARPALSLTFQDGMPVFFQAVDDQGRFQRGCFRPAGPTGMGRLPGR